jgi:ribosome maturation factor RimP
MALQIETIRATADRVAASHHLDVVDLEFTGGAKHRTLRVFLEKDAAAAPSSPRLAAADEEAGLPKGVPVEMLSFVTHEDCASFARDFGTVLDIEDLIPGAEYTLEVSSPGLERKLLKPADYTASRARWSSSRPSRPVDKTATSPAASLAFDGKNLTLDLSRQTKGQGQEDPDRADRHHRLVQR